LPRLSRIWRACTRSIWLMLARRQSPAGTERSAISARPSGTYLVEVVAGVVVVGVGVGVGVAGVEVEVVFGALYCLQSVTT
jgi:hypothetical protein